MKIKKACSIFYVEVTLCDGSVFHFNCRSQSSLEKYMHEHFDFSCIDDYVIKEVAYYEFSSEVMV